MKAILMSIKPKWVTKILIGEKIVEIRKKFPKDYKGWVYIYCSKTFTKWKGARGYRRDLMINDCVANGKVVARFYCDKVEEYPSISDRYDELIGSCLSEKELLDYSTISFKDNVRVVKSIYAIHISSLEIFDKPKELKNFRKYCGKTFDEYSCIDCKAYKVDWDLGNWCKKSELILTKAPQNFCYVEVDE